MKGEDIKIVDATGLYCPEPIMLLHKAVREVSSGDRIQLIATDPSTSRDVVKFCEFLGHELIDQNEIEGVYHLVIVKG